jgi:hypothetical protein
MRNWVTHEIMKTLIKNKQSYQKRIASADDNQDSFMEDGKGGNEGRDRDEEERRDKDEEENGDGDENDDDDGEEQGVERDEDKERNEEESGSNYDRRENGNDGEENTEEGENAKMEGFEGNSDKEVRSDVGNWPGFGATTSQSAAAKKLKISMATSKVSIQTSRRWISRSKEKSARG